MDSIPIQVTELLNYSYSLAKALLEEQKEFFPFGVSMDYEGNIKQRLVHDGDAFPLSNVLVDVIQRDFDAKLVSRSLSAYSIIYDARVRNTMYPEGIDVVVAMVKGIHDESAEVYYLPYKKIEGQLQYFEPWGER
ncbi:hypothetical protein [Pedobacter frigoris]|uniref:Uncharacterized protein n=1 Tax=Pedobacter frigoris TaxID=2571272 RepID=A0A4U1CC25_9SPHI|nr:hypothetical protein [Pedobacter frigoris]TKC04279.1 hypothetical protein FA047_16965 [Pedobacter frigoris]